MGAVIFLSSLKLATVLGHDEFYLSLATRRVDRAQRVRSGAGTRKEEEGGEEKAAAGMHQPRAHPEFAEEGLL